MQVYDNHIHMMNGECDPPAVFLEKTAEAGVVGGNVISIPPESFRKFDDGTPQDHRATIDHVMEFTSQTPGFNPFFWIDPKSANAIEQVEEAKKCGIKGIKVICTNFFAEECMDVWQKVADENLPLLFHSGILWNEEPSTAYNRPPAFECLMNIKGLRFALAHISWPWCDDCVALYGKLKHVANQTGKETFRMYIDTTPGTPPVYRKDALRKLYYSYLGAKKSTIFGSDNCANNYSPAYTKRWIDADTMYMRELIANIHECVLPDANGVQKWTGEALDAEEFLRLMFAENYLEFINQSI